MEGEVEFFRGLDGESHDGVKKTNDDDGTVIYILLRFFLLLLFI